MAMDFSVDCLLTIYLAMAAPLVLKALAHALDANSGESFRRHCTSIVVLDVLLIAGVTFTFFNADEMIKCLHGLNVGGISRGLLWFGYMTGFVVLVNIAGAFTFWAANHIEFHRLVPGGDDTKKDRATDLFLLPIVVMSWLVFTTSVVACAAARGEFNMTDGLCFEAWALLQMAAGLWLLLQACAIAISPEGRRFRVGAFYRSGIATLVPFASDCFDSSKDIMFFMLALNSGDSGTHAIGYISAALLVIVQLRTLALLDGRLYLRKNYLNVFLLDKVEMFEPLHGYPNVVADSVDKVPSLFYLLMEVSTPDRIRFLMLEDVPQGILAWCLTLRLDIVSSQIIILNLGFPLVRITVFYFMYPYLIASSVVLRHVTWLLLSDIRPAIRSWLFDQLSNAIRRRGAMDIGRRIIEAFDKDRESIRLRLIELFSAGAHQHYALDVDFAKFELADTNFLAAFLAGFLQGDDKFQVWLLQNNKIGDAGASDLAKALTFKEIGAAGVLGLAESLQVSNFNASSTLQRFDLSSNKIGDAGAADLAKALEVTSLQDLRLSKNIIRDKGAVALAKAIEDALAPLEKLDLSGNQIGDEGAVALAKALEVNRTLKWLDMSGNRLSGEGAAAFVTTLKGSKLSEALEHLDLRSNDFGSAGNEALQGAVAAIQAKGGSLNLFF